MRESSPLSHSPLIRQACNYHLFTFLLFTQYVHDNGSNNKSTYYIQELHYTVLRHLQDYIVIFHVKTYYFYTFIQLIALFYTLKATTVSRVSRAPPRFLRGIEHYIQ